jgi:N6-L-threonylcarbamoyladenine synthase
LRARLAERVASRGGQVYFPDLAFCTDNGAMIALAGALRLDAERPAAGGFTIRPRWPLRELAAPQPT